MENRIKSELDFLRKFLGEDIFNEYRETAERMIRRRLTTQKGGN